jgi:Spy/CpxP family protein refolding chaperone
MNIKFKKAVLLGMAAAFLLGSTLHAEGPYEGTGRRNSEKKFAELTQELGITPEQETKLKEQQEGFRAKGKRLMKNIQSRQKELKQELEKKDVDRARIDKLIEEIKDLTGEKLRNRVDKIMAMKSVLTPEQFEKLQSKAHKKGHFYTQKGRRNKVR